MASWFLCRKHKVFVFFFSICKKDRNELLTGKQSTNQLDNQSGILFSIECKDKFHIWILSHGAYFIHDYYRMIEDCVLHFCFLWSNIQFQFPESVLCKQKCKLSLLSLRVRRSVERVRCLRQKLTTWFRARLCCSWVPHVIDHVFWIVLIVLLMCWKKPAALSGFHPFMISFTCTQAVICSDPVSIFYTKGCQIKMCRRSVSINWKVTREDDLFYGNSPSMKTQAVEMKEEEKVEEFICHIHIRVKSLFSLIQDCYKVGVMAQPSYDARWSR